MTIECAVYKQKEPLLNINLYSNLPLHSPGINLSFGEKISFYKNNGLSSISPDSLEQRIEDFIKNNPSVLLEPEDFAEIISLRDTVADCKSFENDYKYTFYPPLRCCFSYVTIIKNHFRSSIIVYCINKDVLTISPDRISLKKLY